ncbi:glycerate kinase [Xylanimonas protaetiae]|uniref:Uncharacterized protein n=1 Tax=Xylanimonas protaetiae TaxID=2509457 RepID=A0A4P6F8V4_9MICO|nr:glycerate kinase [Xylanimonas protaetiae]QAY71323.1 hypothetical protein ET471_15860 [Xylanimonas protaetiae]
MHVLLLAADARLAGDLAAAWATAAAGSVGPAVLPARSAAPAPSGVFVPVSALGLSRRPSAASEEERLRALVADADVVVVHVDVLDAPALHEGPLPLVARVAGERALPVVVLAGRAEASRREWSAAGVSGVHEVGEEPGDRATAVARAGRTWAPSWPRT